MDGELDTRFFTANADLGHSALWNALAGPGAIDDHSNWGYLRGLKT
jgi:hypothetical protein